jgi:hypothetical protein
MSDIDLHAMNAAISINALLDYEPPGSKRTAMIQLDVIQAIRSALFARGIDPVKPAASIGELEQFLISNLLAYVTVDGDDVFAHWKGERRSVKAMATEYLGSKK